ncbi:MAG: hypothetical protein AAB460_00640 [Patescibacteria group bacterium]
MTKKASSSNKAEKTLAISAGVAALAAASYYLFGPHGKQHRKKAQGWMIKMKGEVIEQLENLKEVSEPVYRDIVESVAARYVKNGKISRAEVNVLAKDLKGMWRGIASKQKRSAGVKKVKRAIKRAVRTSGRSPQRRAASK